LSTEARSAKVDCRTLAKRRAHRSRRRHLSLAHDPHGHV